MVPANKTKLEKASRELLVLSKTKGNAQDSTLSLLRTLELLHNVLVDLAFRPEVNS